MCHAYPVSKALLLAALHRLFAAVALKVGRLSVETDKRYRVFADLDLRGVVYQQVHTRRLKGTEQLAVLLQIYLDILVIAEHAVYRRGLGETAAQREHSVVVRYAVNDHVAAEQDKIGREALYVLCQLAVALAVLAQMQIGQKDDAQAAGYPLRA